MPDSQPEPRLIKLSKEVSLGSIIQAITVVGSIATAITAGAASLSKIHDDLQLVASIAAANRKCTNAALYDGKLLHYSMPVLGEECSSDSGL